MTESPVIQVVESRLPRYVIFDLWTTFPKVVHKVWLNASFQYDYFHVMQWL